MDNNAVGFKEYNGKKSDLVNITVEPGDIIFGIDSETDLPYIYHNGVFYSDASEWSEALPEIHIGKTAPSEKKGFKLWIDTNDNPLSLKYKDVTTNKWVSTNEIYIGDTLPEDASNIKVWYQTNVNLPEEDIVVSWEDVENKPTFAKVAFSGSYTDLKDVPDTIKKTYYAHGQVDRHKYTLTDEQLIDNINTQKSIENKENANYIIHIVDTDKYYPVNKVSQEASYVKTLYAVVFEDDDNNIGNNIVNPIVTSVKLNIHNGEILGGNPNGGSGDAFVDSAYLSTEGYVNSHTTTYIGKEDPSTISSKYNLWVDTADEEVVFKYKDANNAWQVLSTGGNGNIEVDTLLDPTSENPIANKAVYELATVIGEDFEAISNDLSKKASTENGLVEGRGFKVNDNLKYYLPNTTTTTDPTVDDTHIIATKADVLSNEVIDSKATVYNLYAMDELTAEQLAANEAALVSVQNREVAIYKVYTDDDTYAIADVKIVDGPYLEAYVYVNTPNPTDKQATITRYKYSFNQAGEYLPSDKDVEEVIVPSIAKVNELISSGGTGGSGGGLEIRELKISDSEEDNAYNLDTLELMRENKVLPALKAGDVTFVPLTYVGDNQFSLQVVKMGIEMHLSLTIGEDGSVTMSQDVIAPYVLNSPSRVLEWIDKNRMLALTGMHETAMVVYNGQFCLIDYNKATTGDNSKKIVQFNYGSQRFERVYDATTGEEISTTEIPLGGGGGTAAEGVKMYKVYQNPKDADELAANKAAYDAIAAGEDAIYQMNWIIGWITATYALTMMDICGLAFGLTAPADDGSCVQSGNVSLLINSDGSILSFEEKQVYAPSTEKVEEMIANVGGGGGGENNSNSKNIYNIYCALSEDEAEKAKQLESNVIAYNACMNNEDALYTIFIEKPFSFTTSMGVLFEEDAMFMGDLTVGTDSAGVLFAFEVTLHADGTSDVKSYNYTLTESNAIVYFLDTTTTEKTIEGVSNIIEYISAGKGVTVVWYKGDGNFTTCSDVSVLSSTSIAVGMQENGAYATYIISNKGEITDFLKVGTVKLYHSTVENEGNKKAIGPLSMIFSGASDLKAGLSLSILHKPNYYQVLHTKKVDDSYKMKVILDDNSFGTYTLQSNGILTLDS